MDLIIKNLESLKYFENKPQPKAITIDIKKVIEDSVEFSETFEKSCEKYKELERTCQNCEYFEIESGKEPCRSCWESLENRPNWKPKGPDLKELYKKYVEVGESYLVPNEDIKKAMKTEKTCRTCKYHDLEVYEEPCQSCIGSYLSLDEMNPNWEPAEPIHKEAYIKMCANCKYCEIDASQEPCRSCWRSMENRPNNWEPSEPTLKEVTERMQSEFDATGKDVKIFMNERVIKK